MAKQFGALSEASATKRATACMACQAKHLRMLLSALDTAPPPPHGEVVGWWRTPEVGKVGKVGEVGKVGREGLFMPTWS